jgi:hypothetical protein
MPRFALARFFLAAFLALAALGTSAASVMPDFDRLEKQLKIRPGQKAQFDLAVGATKRALLAVSLMVLHLKERLAVELAKDNPDFAALARSHQEILDQIQPQFKEAGEEWRKLYAILDPDQVEMAKSFIRENFSRFIPQ